MSRPAVPSSSYVDAPVYVQVEPDFVGPHVRSARVVRATGSRPRQPLGGTVTVAMVLRIPKSALSPLSAGIIAVPEGSAKPVFAEVVEQ